MASCPVSALPVKYWCRGLFWVRECEGVIRGILRTKSHPWPWTSVIDVKCDHENHQGLLYLWFYWPPCQAVCSLREKKTCIATVYVFVHAHFRDTAKLHHNHMLGFVKWIHILFVATTIYRAILSSDHNDIEYYTQFILSWLVVAGSTILLVFDYGVLVYTNTPADQHNVFICWTLFRTAH